MTARPAFLDWFIRVIWGLGAFGSRQRGQRRTLLPLQDRGRARASPVRQRILFGAFGVVSRGPFGSEARAVAVDAVSDCLVHPQDFGIARGVGAEGALVAGEVFPVQRHGAFTPVALGSNAQVHGHQVGVERGGIWGNVGRGRNRVVHAMKKSFL